MIPIKEVTKAVLIPPKRPLILLDRLLVLLVSIPAKPKVKPAKVPKIPIPVKRPAKPDQKPALSPPKSAAGCRYSEASTVEYTDTAPSLEIKAKLFLYFAHTDFSSSSSASSASSVP